MPADTPAETIDARGLKCPLPVLKAEKRLAALPSGAILVVLATDPMARIDLPLHCRQHGHACSMERHTDGSFAFTVVKDGGTAAAEPVASIEPGA